MVIFASAVSEAAFSVLSLVSSHPDKATAWYLRKFLLQHSSPLCVSDSVLKQWLIAHNGNVTQVLNAAELDKQFGALLREQTFDNASQLQSFLLREKRVTAQERTCNTWLTTDWYSRGLSFLFSLFP